jgi:AcrR family transcriptional regulator
MQTRSVATINTILDAAKLLFIQKQYADVTLREITEAAGVTKGALYHHFASKDELFSRTIHRCLEEVKETIQLTVNEYQNESCRVQLQQALTSFLKLHPDTRAVMRSLRRNLDLLEEPMRSDLIQAYQHALPEQLEALLANGIAKGEIIPMDARLLSWQHVAVVEVTLYEFDRGLLGGPEDMAASIVNLFFKGISASRES